MNFAVNCFILCDLLWGQEFCYLPHEAVHFCPPGTTTGEACDPKKRVENGTFSLKFKHVCDQGLLFQVAFLSY